MCNFQKFITRALGIPDPVTGIDPAQKAALDQARFATDQSAMGEAERQAAEARLRRLLSANGYGSAIRINDPMTAPPVAIKDLMGQ